MKDMDSAEWVHPLVIVRKSNVLKDVFSRQGIPTIVMSDNGPEFSSIKFREFSVNWEFKHIKSSPRYPQSNGLVERVIRVGPNINRFPDVLENREEALGEAGDRNNVSNSQGDLSKSRSGRVVKTPALYKDFVMM
ncbi:hypothetical protein HUJ04_011013 [Dendroctonus ponderosae]|nr:hypothetical protein HUJ04_011013 [Dendroctonus ponderosae]